MQQKKIDWMLKSIYFGHTGPYFAKEGNVFLVSIFWIPIPICDRVFPTPKIFELVQQMLCVVLIESQSNFVYIHTKSAFMNANV